MKKLATFSPDKKYRYVLIREWDYTRGHILFVGLNPSTADEKFDDATIRRLTDFADKWGYGALRIVNLFAYRSRDWELLRKMQPHKDPIGPENDLYINRELINRPSKIVVMWGNRAHKIDAARTIFWTRFFKEYPGVLCFGKNQNGSPIHPLFLSSQTKLINFG